MNKRKPEPPTHSERVALLARVSTAMQAEEGLSIAAQLAEMREAVAARGWIVAAEFIDAGISGQTMDRPGLQAMLAAAEQGSFDILMVHELSRLSRSVFDTFAIFEELGRHQIGFVSVKEPQFDLTTPTGRFTLTLLAAINQYYIDILRMHTKKAKRQRAREGLYNASISPYGYRRSEEPRQPPEIDEAEAKVVRATFERYASGRYSIQEITDFLNDSGYRTRAGRRFSKDTVTDMLRNAFYVGKVVYKEGLRGDVGDVYNGKHKPILTEDIWDATVRIRQRHQHASRTLQTESRSYLLSQIAHCHACGRRLRAQGVASGGYYRETSYSRGFDDCPSTRLGAKGEILHQQIGTIVRLLKLPKDWLEELAEMVGEDEEVATLQNKRARLTAERRRLKDLYIRGDFDDDPDMYRAEMERIRRALDQMPTEDEMVALRQAGELLSELSDVWDEADPGDQRDLMRLMLREMQVDVAQDRIVLLQPSAPFIPIFRAVPLLQQRDLGTFVPVWPPEQADQSPLPKLEPLKELPDKPVDLPFLPTWPLTVEPGARISPALSDLLKERRKERLDGGTLVAVPHRGIPDVLVDGRRWGEVSLERMSLKAALERPAASISILDTALVLQDSTDPGQMAQRVFDRLEQNGHWHMIELLPASMPAHWLFTFFPPLWPYARGGSYWNNGNFYNKLRKIGFQVTQRERTFYQPIQLGLAREIAQGRPGLLAKLGDDAYQAGLERLETAISEKGASALIGSEVTLIEVTAFKGEPRKLKIRRRIKAPEEQGEESK